MTAFGKLCKMWFGHNLELENLETLWFYLTFLGEKDENFKVCWKRVENFIGKTPLRTIRF